MVIVFAIVGGAAGALYGLLAPAWYESSLAVVPGPKATSSFSAASMLAAEIPLDLNLGTTDADRILGVLRSRTVTDDVIRKLDLQARYHSRSIERARITLWKHCNTKIDKKPSIVTLTCEDKDPVIAQKIVSEFADAGNEACRRIASSSAGEERRFLEKRVAEARADASAASSKLRDFMEKNKLVDLPEQSKAVVSALATLKGDLLSKQIQLSYLDSFSSSDEATSTQLRRQIGVMQQKLHSLEDEAQSDGSVVDAHSVRHKPDDIFPPAMNVPRLRYQLQELYRDEKVSETLFLMLTQRFELARINEARDTSAFQILDAPVVAGEKSRPTRWLCGLLGLLLGLSAGFIFEYRIDALRQWLPRRDQRIRDAA